MNINRKKTEKRTKQIPDVKTIITELKNSWGAQQQTWRRKNLKSQRQATLYDPVRGKKKKIKKNEETLRDLHDTIRQTNICIRRIPGEKKGADSLIKYFNKILFFKFT